MRRGAADRAQKAETPWTPARSQGDLFDHYFTTSFGCDVKSHDRPRTDGLKLASTAAFDAASGGAREGKRVGIGARQELERLEEERLDPYLDGLSVALAS